jgi:hypothetical protein
MTPSEFWRNFKLCEEIHVSGTFIYNGLRRFHEIRKLSFHDEIFDFLYNLSVGLERLLKITIVLYEYKAETNQEDLEQSLITHNHIDLAARVRKCAKVSFGDVHNDLLSLLSKFYKTLRYDRFSLNSIYAGDKETVAVCNFLSKHLQIDFSNGNELYDFIGISNEDRYRKFIQRTTLKIARDLYEAIEVRAKQLNLYTYELRYESKAASIFLREINIADEDILWKELLIFLMNNDEDTQYLQLLRDIQPIAFDPALISDYLECFKSNPAKASVMDELEHHYEQMDTEERKERFSLMGIIGDDLYFNEDEDEDAEDL